MTFHLMKTLCPSRLAVIPLVVGVMTTIASAATIITETFTVSTTVPDNDDIGLSDNRMISAPGLNEILDVDVGLVFSGGWNGDLYVYLVHGSGFSVLLNRVGRTVLDPEGSASSGITITLDDEALNEAHVSFPDTGVVTGFFQPDGRETDPWFTLDTDPRLALLDSFDGLDPNGEWTLFVADQSAGETSVLQSWSLTITAIPEPGAATIGLAGVALLLRRQRRRTGVSHRGQSGMAPP